MGLRFIISLNFVCKGIRLYLHEVPDIDIQYVILCGLQCRTYTNILKSKVLQGSRLRAIRTKKSLVGVDFTFSLVSSEVQVAL